MKLRGHGKVAAGVGLATLVALILIARALAPAFILKKVNETLATISPVYKIHVEDLDLSLLAMFYRFENIEGTLKATNAKFLQVERVDVSIAWRELLRGRILTVVEADKAIVEASKPLFAQSKSPKAEPVKAARQAAGVLFPVRVDRVVLRDSAIRLGALVGQPESDIFQINDVKGTIRNLTPREKDRETLFAVEGLILKSAEFRASGKLRRLDSPMGWQARAEIRHFNLPRANPLVSQVAPISFKKGNLDLFAESASKGGSIVGYVKPFFQKAELLGDKKDFKGIKHFGVELIGAIGNAILRRGEDDTVATRIEFQKNGDHALEVKTDKALSKAIDHGFGKPLKRGFDSLGSM